MSYNEVLVTYDNDNDTTLTNTERWEWESTRKERTGD